MLLFVCRNNDFNRWKDEDESDSEDEGGRGGGGAGGGLDSVRPSTLSLSVYSFLLSS